MKAEDPRQSATSCYWQGLGAESRGLYQDAQNHFREGLNLPYEHARTRILLRINLANAYRLHGGLLEARTIVSEVRGDVRAGETRASQHFNRSMLAFAAALVPRSISIWCRAYRCIARHCWMSRSMCVEKFLR